MFVGSKRVSFVGDLEIGVGTGGGEFVPLKASILLACDSEADRGFHQSQVSPPMKHSNKNSTANLPLPRLNDPRFRRAMRTWNHDRRCGSSRRWSKAGFTDLPS